MTVRDTAFDNPQLGALPRFDLSFGRDPSTDEVTLFPGAAEDATLITTWITVDEETAVDIREVR
jgi:hypothetical protein